MIKVYGNSESSLWNGALSELPPASRDVYFTPEYHGLHVANGDGAATCTAFSEAGQILLVPGLIVPFSTDLALELNASYWDLQTCNGYGGPVASPDATPEFLAAAWREWRIESARAGIVAAFLRLHPLLRNEMWLPSDARVILERQTVFVDLAEGLQVAWDRADSRHRNMVNKGRREGLCVRWDDPADWEDFESLYHDSMQRLSAPELLRFSHAYFIRLRELPGVHLASVRAGNQLSAAAVFMFGPCWGHYHLSARRQGSGNHLTNNILQAGIEHAAAARLQGLHLGGGRTRSADDRLLKFKQSLGGSLLDFKVALVVANVDAYARFCSAWAKETGAQPQWLLGYRQPKPDLLQH